MGLERIFGDFDAWPPTYLIHFKWKFDVDIGTPFKIIPKNAEKKSPYRNKLWGYATQWRGYVGIYHRPRYSTYTIKN